MHQQNNFGQGVDNALFYTPPDGVPAQMMLTPRNLASPGREGALENNVAHKNTYRPFNWFAGRTSSTDGENRATSDERSQREIDTLIRMLDELQDWNESLR